MSAILVDHEEFNSFLFAIGHFPEGTPNRFELVAEFVRSQPREGNAPSPIVCLSSSKHGKTEKRLPLTEKKQTAEQPWWYKQSNLRYFNEI